ncbi:MAG TPA: glycosyltransferase, partial [Burkholderiales bacterium]|nr:glycosyltransferase [Burkholderiales bacterium]
MLRFAVSKETLTWHMQDVVVSVVVPTRARPVLLARCLKTLCSQTLAPAHYEIIIVDDGPDRETRRTVETCAASLAGRGPFLHYVASNGPHGPAAARNRGWKLARGGIVAFTDDDTEPDANWLAAGLAAFDGETDAVSGRIVVPLPPAPTDYEFDVAGLARAEFATANVFCRKSVLTRIEGFDERFPLAWREDSDLQFRLLRAGASIRKAGDAVVVHPVRAAGWGVSLRQQKKVMFDVLLYREHPRLYRDRIRRAPRWDYYITVAALLIGAAALALGADSVVIAAAAVWTSMTVWLCAKRLRHSSRRLRHIAEIMVTSV